MKSKTKKHKVLYGSAVTAAYLFAFIFIQSNNWGVLPLVAVTLLFAWLFHLATGLDPLDVTDKENTEKQNEQNNGFKHLEALKSKLYKWKKHLFVLLALLSITVSGIFFKAQETFESCVLKYAVKAKLTSATSILEDACYDLHNGSKDEVRIAKCEIKHVSKASNNDAVYLAQDTCKAI